MYIVIVLMGLVTTTHCYGTKLVEETGFQVLPGYKSYDYDNGFIKYYGLLELEEGSVGYPLDKFVLIPDNYHIYTLRDVENDEMYILEEYQTIINFKYGHLLIDRLKIENTATTIRARVPIDLWKSVNPVVKRFNANGSPDLIKVYYSMSQPKDRPCYYQLYELTSASDKVQYMAQGSLVEVNDEKVCETYLKVQATPRRYGQYLVDETHFNTLPDYKEHKLAKKGVKFNGKHDTTNPPKEVMLKPQYYVYKEKIGGSTLHITLNKKYQTKVNLYYGEELVDQLRVRSIETKPDAEIPPGLVDCVNPVVMSVNSEGRPTLIKVYYSMTTYDCPCHYQLYERTSDSNSDRPYRPQGSLVKLYNDIECAKYLKLQA